MSLSRPNPHLFTVIESIASVTGDQIAFSATNGGDEVEHSWDVRGSSGELFGVLTVRPDGRALDAGKHRLYDSLSQVLADDIDLRSANQRLEERFERTGQHNEELMRANARLKEAAFEDTVTGLYRRSYFRRQLELEIARAQRYERPFALLLTDIDFFKEVNDAWGHAAGDTALRHLSRLMMQSSRTSDIVSRFGGDEFCLLLTDTDLEGATEVAQRILKRCGHSPVRWGDISFRISVSIGVGAFEHDGITEACSPETLLDHVDQALYRSKREGRGRISIAPPLAEQTPA